MVWTQHEQKILRRGGKNTQKNYLKKKKDLQDPYIHDGMTTHLGAYILECEAKWALGSISTKLVEVMELQLSYLKS